MNNAAQSVLKSLLLPLALGLLLPVGLTACSRCSKQEPPPPLPSSEPQTTASAPLELAVEDAGVDADADAEAGKKTGTYRKPASLKACCQALSQNAASAPPPTNMYMLQAAAACNAAVAQGKSNASVLGVVRGALKGAGMPSACR